jgi:hypothetical protein
VASDRGVLAQELKDSSKASAETRKTKGRKRSVPEPEFDEVAEQEEIVWICFDLVFSPPALVSRLLFYCFCRAVSSVHRCL